MFDCVMLAAGASSRMGGERPKPLLPFGKTTLVETAVRSALDALCRVILVVGNRGEEVAAPFSATAYIAQRVEGRLLVVDNPRWEEGMVGSIRVALPLVRGEAFFVAHADMPFVRPEDYAALAAAWSEGAVLASHGGAEGHPALLPSAWVPDILALGPGERLKPFLAGRRRALVERGPGALRDIDTPEDYDSALDACLRGRSM